MDKKCVRGGFGILLLRNIEGVISNTSLPKTNIYSGGVAMFSPYFCNKIPNIAKTKIKYKI